MPVVPQSGGGGLAALLKMLGVQMPPPVPQADRQPWQDMPGSQPRPVADAVLGALTDFPKGMVTGGAAQPGPSWENAGAVAAAVMALGPLLGKIVYHGSPHVFDKFDMSKIGTGEGAQAYGHGLYFADSPGVASSYRPSRVGYAGEVPDAIKAWEPGADPLETAKSALTMWKGDAKKAKSAILHTAGLYEGGVNQKHADWYKKAAALVDTLDPSLVARVGAEYSVDLPDEAIANMLDWDAPLSQQSPNVQKALGELGVRPRARSLNWRAEQATADDVAAKSFGPSVKEGDWVVVQRDATGKVEYHAGQTFGSSGTAQKVAEDRNRLTATDRNERGEALYHDMGNAREASNKLREKGVPGIRYFDGSSRGKGEGSRNYVVFDDQLPKIVKVER
jgi:hypothetical protein